MKTRPKKLRLKKETLNHLDGSKLRQVLGGTVLHEDPNATDGCSATCLCSLAVGCTDDCTTC